MEPRVERVRSPIPQGERRPRLQARLRGLGRPECQPRLAAGGGRLGAARRSALAAMRRLVAAAVLLAAAPGFAHSVSMSGSLGDKALLVIDGTPRTVAAGATVQ